ncbi:MULTISPECIES: hypothetical protein [Acinetobacter]|uniref:Phage tail protein n=1 Tax=Acinetobacter ursingii TaxID=108980 RepID=A0A7T9UH88_9GAMM|nr:MULTISPECIES: hypothetical protein [Acinetobacter]ENX48762.1 hypothetical protein F943_02299 [Acinetobacter ursingii NIPH 706]EXD37903.1 hypothetical protein J500_0364 [Acinetobacter sp. 479375]MCH2014701.1 hypothetical protein [Acinetobacter ursingii]MCU4522570.1 hypothetical protein [Acinetobacter ursingii]MCU4587409.1 hypothetical protein [Acinetobacter ursingii]
MAEKAVGTIVLSVNGDEYDCVSCSPKTETGKKPVKTMNRSRKVTHTTDGIETHALDVVVIIPDGKDINWLEVEDARISIESLSGKFRETFIDCTTQSMSDSYEVDGETRRSLTMFALDKLGESL